MIRNRMQSADPIQPPPLAQALRVLHAKITDAAHDAARATDAEFANGDERAGNYQDGIATAYADAGRWIADLLCDPKLFHTAQPE